MWQNRECYALPEQGSHLTTAPTAPAGKAVRGGPATMRSTIALKALMAVTGLIMVLFLLGHMLGNMWVFAGQAEFDGYAHHIRTLGEAERGRLRAHERPQPRARKSTTPAQTLARETYAATA